jgi:hypothetical protein
MAFGLSSAMLVIGCGGPEYRPSASTEANQSQKPDAAKSKDPIIVIAQPKPDQTNAGAKTSSAVAVDPASQNLINACIAAAKAAGNGPMAVQPSAPASVALVETAAAATAGTATITCNGKTYPLPSSVQQTGQPLQTNKPVVQMPQQ